jgi:cytochrome d ubiquinol oxidase subunit II
VSLNGIWFLVLGGMLTTYAILDGFDLGAGVLHLYLGRDARERATVIDAIGPVWNGNEVWLIAAGGAMVVAFPHLYATSFSGFYLALMLVLWLLLGRGIAIEFRHQIDNPLWHEGWDVVLSGASTLLALLFGVAAANVLRGLPFDENGGFVGTFAVMLNPFALLGGLLSVAMLALHGASWVALKTEGAVHDRARRAAGGLWWVALALLAVVVAASFVVRPDFTRNFAGRPWLLVAPAGALVAMVLARRYRRRGDDLRAFAASAAWIAGILASVGVGLYPRLLPSLAGSAHPGLDVYNAAAPQRSLEIALGIYLFGMTLVAIYLVNVYRIWRGKVRGVVYRH